MRSRQLAGSMIGGPKWLRTKNKSLGVNSSVKAATGVSRSCGRALRTISLRASFSARAAGAARDPRIPIRINSRRLVRSMRETQAPGYRSVKSFISPLSWLNPALNALACVGRASALASATLATGPEPKREKQADGVSRGSSGCAASDQLIVARQQLLVRRIDVADELLGAAVNRALGRLPHACGRIHDRSRVACVIQAERVAKLVGHRVLDVVGDAGLRL